MLSQLASHGGFELIIFTTGDKEFTNGIMKALEEKDLLKYFSHILNKQYINKSKDSSVLLKDINMFTKGGRVKDILFIDTSLDNLVKSLSNGLVVPRYVQSEKENEDKTLLMLTEYLLEFSKVDDIR